MPIRADVYELQSIAKQVRAGSGKLTSEASRLNQGVSSIVWKGNAYQWFIQGFRSTNSKMGRTADKMNAFADTLERIAEAFRQADLAEDRRREQEELARRQQEAYARAASKNR
ncbi:MULTISPECIES: WXG100 family type VII secretion target [unclassified Paenibacillus]|uniref:WXG100 family type VII secretion target n=1 Tax=unclassified Paenibacillus TaxID=185978 RepID=UPI000839BABC|nr:MULTISPECIES: WXG100 family type VII secretion target [unclassified Paenibacillus]NWL90479.1 WXG100 family type VII secretion target [Paenibacillus sp. 79R4]